MFSTAQETQPLLKLSSSLLDHRKQEDYFSTIQTRYEAFARNLEARIEDGDPLAGKMATLSVEQHVLGSTTSSMRKVPRAAAITTASTELNMITMAMRKLREAIVATKRNDTFAATAYLFIVRTAIIIGHSESYHPALLHLINRPHRVIPISRAEEKEIVCYFLLDLACRQRDFATAFQVGRAYKYRSMRFDRVMRALVHGDWVLFARAKRGADLHEQHLMQWADERMAGHALQCMGKSYLSLPKNYVEQSTGMRWEELKEAKKLSWTLDDHTIVIRQVRKR
ncbi:MAG: hypothetical protein Q9207_006579 [Kuettlingeria erythrocarpa]